MVGEAVRAGTDIRWIVVREDQLRSIDGQFEGVRDDQFMSANDVDFASISSLKSPEGILAVAAIREADPLPEPPFNAPWFVLDAINDPGNLGTIMRVADWFGFEGVVLLPGCADVYNPKTLRSSMGAVFHIRIASATVADLSVHSDLIYRAQMSGSDMRVFDPPGNPLFVMGSESHGISAEMQSLGSGFKIPGYGQAESLNVGVAAGVVGWEWLRRNKEIKK